MTRPSRASRTRSGLSTRSSRRPPAPKLEEDVVLPAPRRRTQVAFYGNPTPTASALKRGGPPSAETRSSGSKITRSSTRRQSEQVCLRQNLLSRWRRQHRPKPRRPPGLLHAARNPRQSATARCRRRVAGCADEWLQSGESSGRNRQWPIDTVAARRRQSSMTTTASSAS